MITDIKPFTTSHFVGIARSWPWISAASDNHNEWISWKPESTPRILSTILKSEKDLSIDDGLIVYGCHSLNLIAMRHQVLSDFHEPHQRSVCTKQQAHLIVYWPGLNNDILDLPSHLKELLIQEPKLFRCFQEVAAGYCSFGGKHFLILVHCFINWPEVIPKG